MQVNMAPANINSAPQFGIVIIGRNEGDRLRACLDSIAQSDVPVAYVDSGSTDDSVSASAAAGCSVVELPMDKPFTAGRARNAGFERLKQLRPQLDYVQFVDGDCRIAESWLEFAEDYLGSHPDAAIVCGRRSEIHPEHSWYNRLCDIEWDTPIGAADACGGDFMARASAFDAAGGFDERLIAGEEPELCFRLRQTGWKIYRADRLMTYHDAGMTRFSQWLRRAMRSGYAYAAGGSLHRRTPGGFRRRENLRIAFWGGLLPLAAVVGAILVSPWLLLLLLAYPVQFVRLWLAHQNSANDFPAARYALFMLLAKWPEHGGQLLFLSRRIRGAEQTLIEYK
jgi:GT2 family glycosyltransferase